MCISHFPVTQIKYPTTLNLKDKFILVHPFQWVQSMVYWLQTKTDMVPKAWQRKAAQHTEARKQRKNREDTGMKIHHSTSPDTHTFQLGPISKHETLGHFRSKPSHCDKVYT